MGAAIVAVGAVFLGLAEETREACENMGKLETSFTTPGHSAEGAKNTYTELYGVLGDDIRAFSFLAAFISIEIIQASGPDSDFPIQGPQQRASVYHQNCLSDCGVSP